MEKLGVVVPVDVPKYWNSQMIIATKNSGDIVFALIRNPWNEARTIPVTNQRWSAAKANECEVLHQVRCCISAYWHLVLNNESDYLTTFQAGFDRYWCIRIHFGTCVNSEIFQKRLHLALDGLNGIACVTDNIIVFGTGDEIEHASSDHDINLKLLLQRYTWEENQIEERKRPIEGITNRFHGATCNSWWPTTMPY